MQRALFLNGDDIGAAKAWLRERDLLGRPSDANRPSPFAAVDEVPLSAGAEKRAEGSANESGASSVL